MQMDFRFWRRVDQVSRAAFEFSYATLGAFMKYPKRVCQKNQLTTYQTKVRFQTDKKFLKKQQRHGTNPK
jgi:hypothetical protein